MIEIFILTLTDVFFKKNIPTDGVLCLIFILVDSIFPKQYLSVNMEIKPLSHTPADAWIKLIRIQRHLTSFQKSRRVK